VLLRLLELGQTATFLRQIGGRRTVWEITGYGKILPTARPKSDTATKNCSIANSGCSGNETHCRKGRKALIPWRFQLGRKRSFAKAFGNDCGSMGSPENGCYIAFNKSGVLTFLKKREDATRLKAVQHSALQQQEVLCGVMQFRILE
jgi:hypothetical protein